MNEHEPSILKEPFIPLNDFSKPVLIIGDDKPESSDEDDGFKDIPSQMEFDSSSGIMDTISTSNFMLRRSKANSIEDSSKFLWKKLRKEQN